MEGSDILKKSLNQVREKIILKGFATKTDIMFFCKCGDAKAETIFSDIKNEIESELVTMPDGTKKHKKMNPCGVPIHRLLVKLELSEAKILKYAEIERQKEKDACRQTEASNEPL